MPFRVQFISKWRSSFGKVKTPTGFGKWVWIYWLLSAVCACSGHSSGELGSTEQRGMGSGEAAGTCHFGTVLPKTDASTLVLTKTKNQQGVENDKTDGHGFCRERAKD